VVIRIAKLKKKKIHFFRWLPQNFQFQVKQAKRKAEVR